MKFQQILCYISLISESLIIISLFFSKLKKNYKISFNSFYLSIFNISSLILFHLIILLPFLSSEIFYSLIALVIFIFSYMLRIKRLLDCISLSKIIKSLKIKNKSKILYQKINYSNETIYFLLFIILTISSLSLFYYLKQTIIEKYIILVSSLIILLFFCFKICISDILNKFKKNYIFEIFFSSLLYISFSLLFEPNLGSYTTLYISLANFIIEILYLMCLCLNCGIFYAKKILAKDFVVNEKLKKNFYLFFNNELCLYVFNLYLDENESNSKIYMKLYIDINKYNMKFNLDGNTDDAKNIINFFDTNKELINNTKLNEKFVNINGLINENKFEKNMFDEILTILNNYLNKKFESFKKTKEYNKLFSLLDLIYFLDEYIFVESFYFDYYNNEQLQSIE